MKRVLGNILALISFFLLPFWCTVIICIVLLLIFDFIEIIFFGFLFDVVYGVGGTFLQSNMFILSGMAIYGIMFLIKPYLKL